MIDHASYVRLNVKFVAVQLMRIVFYVKKIIIYKKIKNVVCVMETMNIKINIQIVVSNMLNVRLTIYKLTMKIKLWYYP